MPVGVIVDQALVRQALFGKPVIELDAEALQIVFNIGADAAKRFASQLSELLLA